MKEKSINQWTQEELIDECTYRVWKKVMKGELRDGLVEVFNLISNWLDGQKR